MTKIIRLSVFLFFSCMCISCSNGHAVVAEKVVPNPKGTVKEMRVYHKNAIRRYKLALEKEKHTVHRCLSKQNMTDARSATNRMQYYYRKIEEHSKALDTLQGASL